MSKRFVKVSALSQPYKVCFTTEAQVAFEDAAGGVSFFGVLQAFQEGSLPAVKIIRNLLWAGLTEHQSKITQKDASLIMDELGVRRVAEIVGEAIQLAFPESKEGGGQADNATDEETPPGNSETA